MLVKFIKKTLIVGIGLLLSSQITQAQNVHLGIGGGLSVYNGELETYHFADGIYIKARPALDAYLRINGDGPLGLQAGFWIGSLAGDDRESSSQGRRNRGLRFTSALQTFRVMGEMYPLRWMKNKKKRIRRGHSWFDLYMTMGVEYFRFNPKTDFQNQEFALQPLGTEGQNLVLNDGNEPYSLNQLAVPFGGGLRIKITDDMYLNMQALYHYTRTDYIDDISTTYPDLNLMIESGQELGAQLSFRGDEITGAELPSTGSNRGSSGVKDAFMTGSVSLVFILRSNSRGIGCPTF